MDAVVLLCCFLSVGAVLIAHLPWAHGFFAGEPLTEAQRERLRKARWPYMVVLLPAWLIGSVTTLFAPEGRGGAMLGVFVFMFLFFYFFALRDIRKAVRST